MGGVMELKGLILYFVIMGAFFLGESYGKDQAAKKDKQMPRRRRPW